MSFLLSNHSLQEGRYTIVSVLGKGGFGITYLAEQSGLQRKVAIKEFFMNSYCQRDADGSSVKINPELSAEVLRFRSKFLKEARNIAQLNHPNIVRVIDVFEENDTAYYVMEYVENGSLANKVKQDGPLSEAEATRYIVQVAKALDYVHQRKMVHLDIKPANIMLNENDEAVLIDFGMSKQYDCESGNETSSSFVGISQGYAPLEQYVHGGVGEFSPETDIYALGATFYNLLTGSTPPNAYLVDSKGLPTDELRAHGVSDRAISIISLAMKSHKEDRIKNARAFIEGVRGKTLRPVWYLLAVVGLAVVLAVIMLLRSCSKGGDPNLRDVQKTDTIVNPPSPIVQKVTADTIVLNIGHVSKRKFIYTGEVDDQGLPDGEGEARFIESSPEENCTFKGVFSHGVTSKGVMSFGNGASFDGSFTADGIFADGVWTEANGYYFKGSFKEFDPARGGDPCDGMWYTPSGEEYAKCVNGEASLIE